jgi:hypothetical protein
MYHMRKMVGKKLKLALIPTVGLITIIIIGVNRRRKSRKEEKRKSINGER